MLAGVNTGRILKTLRRQHDLTQQQLAMRLGRSRSFISRIETNRKIVERELLMKLIEKMGASAEEYDSLLETEKFLIHLTIQNDAFDQKPKAKTNTSNRINKLEELIPLLSNYFKNTIVDKAYLFGSFATESQTDDSDIDLLIKFKDEESPTIFDLITIKLDLKNVLAREIDVVQEGSEYEHVRKTLEEDKILVYDSQKNHSRNRRLRIHWQSHHGRPAGKWFRGRLRG